jgi:hypothetical protein
MDILNKSRKLLVLKDFRKHTLDKGGVCILGASIQIFIESKQKFIDFIDQDEVCDAQGETAIYEALREAQTITNKLFPTLKTRINYGEVD